jgi:hypothetical protein
MLRTAWRRWLNRTGPSRPAVTCRPVLEQLEDRTVPTLLGSPTLFNAGSFPQAVAVADFNGDGKADLAVADYSTGKVSILLGNGDGTFQAAHTYDVGSEPNSIAVADLNGDGIPDLVTANRASFTVSVLLGNGDGTFQPQRTFAAGTPSISGYGPAAVAVGDFNGDGIPDIVTANQNTNDVSVLLGTGDGTFQPQQRFAVGNGPYGVALGDFDGSGHLSIVTANYGDTHVSLLLGNGDGTFQPQQPLGPFFFSGVSITTADLNGNGHLDVVAVGGSGTVGVFLGNGDGTFQPVQTYNSGLTFNSGPERVVVADVDGDGHPDILVTNWADQGVGVLLGNGDGTFQPSVNFTAGSWVRGIAVGDFYGDRAPDVVVTRPNDDHVAVLRNLTPVASYLDVVAITDVVVGTPIQFTVTVRNQFGGVFTGYVGTVHFTSSDDQAALPDDYTFSAADNGVATFSVTLNTSGPQSLTATDTLLQTLTGSALWNVPG